MATSSSSTMATPTAAPATRLRRLSRVAARASRSSSLLGAMAAEARGAPRALAGHRGSGLTPGVEGALPDGGPQHPHPVHTASAAGALLQTFRPGGGSLRAGPRAEPARGPLGFTLLFRLKILGSPPKKQRLLAQTAGFLRIRGAHSPDGFSLRDGWRRRRGAHLPGRLSVLPAPDVPVLRSEGGHGLVDPW